MPLSAQLIDIYLLMTTVHYFDRGAQLHDLTALDVKTKRDVRCEMVRSDWPRRWYRGGRPGVHRTGSWWGLPDCTKNPWASQIALSCTAHPFSFPRLGQSIYAVVHPCHFFDDFAKTCTHSSKILNSQTLSSCWSSFNWDANCRVVMSVDVCPYIVQSKCSLVYLGSSFDTVSACEYDQECSAWSHVHMRSRMCTGSTGQRR